MSVTVVVVPDPARAARRWALAGAGVNAVLSAGKLLAAAAGGSFALAADGIESGLDVAGSLIIWGGLTYAGRAPDANHPFGHGKAEPVSAVLVAGALLAAALALAAGSVRTILSGKDHPIPAAWTLLVLVGVVAVKELLFRRVLHAGEALGSTAAKVEAWHHRSDALTSVAAFVGIGLANLGGPRWATADAWAALAACALIAYNGVALLRPAVGEIMDEAPAPEIEHRVRAAAGAVSGVAMVEKCRVRKMGLEFYVDLHIGVDGRISVDAGHGIAHRVKDAVRAADRRVADVLVHVEPAG